MMFKSMTKGIQQQTISQVLWTHCVFVLHGEGLSSVNLSVFGVRKQFKLEEHSSSGS